MDFLQFVVTVTVGHITVGNITVVCSYSWQKLQLSVVTVGRSYSCLWLQLAEVTDNILHLSANQGGRPPDGLCQGHWASPDTREPTSGNKTGGWIIQEYNRAILYDQ